MLEQKRSLSFPLLLRGQALVAILAVFLPLASCREVKGPVPEDAVDRLKALQPESARTRILILATFHLAQQAEAFTPDLLDGLVDRLAAFRPDAICVEALPGSRVQELGRTALDVGQKGH
jgi:hypothetical protein